MTIKKQNIAIIGAGIAGLSLANMLNDVVNIEVFEKSRGYGGRVATRHNEDFMFDHGAQFFTAKNEKFKKFIQPLIDKEIVGIWNAKFVEIDEDKITYKKDWNSHYPHYVGIPKMNEICKHLSNNIETKLNVEVKRIAKSNNDKWQLFDSDSNHLGNFDWIICSAPAFQAQKLLPLEFAHHDKLRSIKMLGCYALMLSFKNKLNVDWDAALVKNSNLSWISFNSSKPARNSSNAVVALASNSWADENIEADLEIVKTEMLNSLSQIVKFSDQDLLGCNIHRWKYANIGKNDQFEYLLDQDKKLAVIGDWCIKGRIESAFISADQLYNQIIKLIS